MGAKTLTISIPQEMYEYLQEDGLLSPSKIFQIAVRNIQQNRKQDLNQIRLLENKNKILQETVFDLQDQITNHNGNRNNLK